MTNLINEIEEYLEHLDYYGSSETKPYQMLAKCVEALKASLENQESMARTNQVFLKKLKGKLNGKDS